MARFPTKKARFASYSGTAPVEASSGEVVRHRLSRWPGIASSTERPAHGRGMPGQVGHPRRGYYRKKIAEGKSRKEALRCLKRRISDAVFKSLVADSQASSRSAA